MILGRISLEIFWNVMVSRSWTSVWMFLRLSFFVADTEFGANLIAASALMTGSFPSIAGTGTIV